MITICDTGPLVAFLNRNDPYHSWSLSVMKQVHAPLRVCEPVLTEAACSTSTSQPNGRGCAR